MNLRECEEGEQFTSTGECDKCPAGTGFALEKMTSPGVCQPCPTDKAICDGGTKIGPKPGYWRKSNKTGVFIDCPNPSACLGMNVPTENPMGNCDVGYEGVLCTAC